MQGNYQKKIYGLLHIIVTACAFFIGTSIFFGDVFFWSSGDLTGHLYAFFSFLALGLRPIYLFLNSIRSVAQFLLAMHLLVTIGYWVKGGGASVFFIFLIGLDLTLLYFGINMSKTHPVRRQ